VLDAIDDTDGEIFPHEKITYKTIGCFIFINSPLKHQQCVIGNRNGCCIAPNLVRKMVHLHFISALTAMFQKTTHF
jgi:hypothetical protein